MFSWKPELHLAMATELCCSPTVITVLVKFADATASIWSQGTLHNLLLEGNRVR